MADETFFGRMKLDRLAKRLKGGSVKARKSAVAALSKMKEPRAFLLLIQALGDADADIRDDAVIALANTNDRRAVKPVAAMLDDKAWQVAKTTVRALEHLGGPDVVEPLVRKLMDRLLQDAIIAALGNLGDGRAALPLAQLLDRTKYIELDSSDIKHPSQLRDKKAVEEYVALLMKAFYMSCGDMQTAEAELQAMLLSVGGDGVGRGIREYNERRASRRKAIAEALGRLGDKRTADALIRALCDLHAEVRLAAADALARLGEPQWRPLVTGKLREDIRALGKSGDRRIADILIGRLDSSDDDMLTGAIMALGELKDERVVPRIAGMYAKAGSDIKCAIIEALGYFDDRLASPVLVSIFRTDEYRRNKAAAALIKIGSKAAVAPLVAELGNKDEFVRRDAAAALGGLGDAGAIKPLLAALEDQKSSVVKEAAGALVKFNDISTVEPMLRVFAFGGKGDVADAVLRMLGGAAHDSEEDARVLERIGNGKIGDQIILMLKANSKHQICQAARLLSALKMKRAVEPLIECLGESDAEVRKSAVKALEELGEPGWKRYVAGGDGDIRHLINCNDIRVEPALRKAVKQLSVTIEAENSYHNVWEFRKNAATTLIALAKVRPELYTFDTNSIACVESRHMDNYTDHSSDCSGDGHTDKGIGLNYDNIRNSL